MPKRPDPDPKLPMQWQEMAENLKLKGGRKFYVSIQFQIFFNHKISEDFKGVGFTDEARKIIQDHTMSGVIFDTTGLTKVPTNVFHIKSDTIDCSETVKIDEDA